MNARETVLHPAILIGIAINVCLLALGILTLNASADAFTTLSTEDGFLEWMQFLSFTALAFMLAFVAVDRYVQQRRASMAVVGLAGLAALVGLAALEEISWFQRVLAIETPEFFLKHNRQNETNLHNMVIGDINVHKQILVKIIFVAGITHNLILPLISRYRPRVRQWVESIGVYLPPLSAAIAYLVLLALSELLLDHPRRGEMNETFGAVHYLSTSFAAYIVGVGYGRPMFSDRIDRLRLSIVFAFFMLFLLFLSWLLGVGYLFKQP